MSKGGEIIPELADLLREIADRIDTKTANPSDSIALRKLARQAGGEDKRFSVKVHARRGQPPLGAEGVDRRFAMAQAVKAYRAEHGGSLNEAYRALKGDFPGGGQGEDTIKDAWQEMSPLFDMSAENRDLILFFKRLEARGLATVTRGKG